MKTIIRIIASFPSYTAPVIALAMITTLGLTSIYSMANLSMDHSIKWKTPVEVTCSDAEPIVEASQDCEC